MWGVGITVVGVQASVEPVVEEAEVHAHVHLAGLLPPDVTVGQRAVEHGAVLSPIERTVDVVLVVDEVGDVGRAGLSEAQVADGVLVADEVLFAYEPAERERREVAPLVARAELRRGVGTHAQFRQVFRVVGVVHTSVHRVESAPGRRLSLADDLAGGVDIVQCGEALVGECLRGVLRPFCPIAQHGAEEVLLQVEAVVQAEVERCRPVLAVGGRQHGFERHAQSAHVDRRLHGGVVGALEGVVGHAEVRAELQPTEQLDFSEKVAEELVARVARLSLEQSDG